MMGLPRWRLCLHRSNDLFMSAAVFSIGSQGNMGRRRVHETFAIGPERIRASSYFPLLRGLIFASSCVCSPITFVDNGLSRAKRCIRRTGKGKEEHEEEDEEEEEEKNRRRGMGIDLEFTYS